MSPSPPQKPTDGLSDVCDAAGDVSPTSPEPRDKRWSSPPSNSSSPNSKSNVASLLDGMGPTSPAITDRVFPIRSVVSVDPAHTPTQRPLPPGDYFHPYSRTNETRSRELRRQSQSSTTSHSSQASQRACPSRNSSSNTPKAEYPPGSLKASPAGRKSVEDASRIPLQLPPQLFNDAASAKSFESAPVNAPSPSALPERPSSASGSYMSAVDSLDDIGGLVAHRFKHVVTDGGHAVITGRDGDTLQRCEDEPIHIPGAVQGFGLLIALQEDPGGSGSLPVRVVSENCKRLVGRSPRELFALESFTDILSEEQADNLLDHIDFVKDEDADVQTNGPDVFTISVKIPNARARKLWCAIHVSDSNPGLVICEFELEDDQLYPLVPPNSSTPELPEDTLNSNPTHEELLESTEIKSRPLRVLRSARKRKGEAAAMEVFNIMSQVQEQLAAAPTLETFLKVLVGVVKELNGFHRVMIYQFDQASNGRVVTELVDPRATKDLFKGLNFPASDIPKQARDLYKINKVRMLYDRDQETARLVCRTPEDLQTPLDLTHSYLRAMSPIHLKYLENMAVRSSMSISINAFDELWGLIACHSYGPRGMRVSFPIRKMCRLVGDSASRNIERLSYAARLQARKLINTVPTSHNPSGYIIASSDDLLKLFKADFGLLSIRDETKILGQIENSQEALAMLEYLRLRKITSVMTSQDVSADFPDLRYPPGFQVIAGMLIVPLSVGGNDFIVFFRKGQMKEVRWAGNPYEKFVKEGTEGYLEPRKSFKTWCETIVGKCREWNEEEIETAAVLCLVYGKFIEVWRQKEAALQNSQLTRLLLANSAHEVRTPLNAIINYLEIALEGSLDSETRENLSRSHSASKSLIYVINDLLDLTKTEEGVSLIKGESFELSITLKEATDAFNGDAKRKNITYEVVEHPGLPQYCIGDQRRVRQAISNITANAIQNTSQGGVKVEMYVASRPSPDRAEVEVAVTDSGVGISSKKLDQLFNDLEQVQSEPEAMLGDAIAPSPTQVASQRDKTALGLGLAVVARIIKNMNGQLRLKSEEGKGSRFVVQFPFDLPDSESTRSPVLNDTSDVTLTQPGTPGTIPEEGERTLVAPTLSRRNSGSNKSVERKPSTESLNGKTSLRSFKSGSSTRSQKSQRSDVDRLIEAIQEPHMVENRASSERGTSPHSMRPTLSKRHSMDPALSITPRRQVGHQRSNEPIVVSPEHRSMEVQKPGQETVSFSGTPLRALKIPDDAGSPIERLPNSGQVLGEVHNEPEEMIDDASTSLSPENMRVLVAEDDPVNSRIVKKRLEKLGHKVHLTVNGEECAGAFGDHPKDFDVVLMDMQASSKLLLPFYHLLIPCADAHRRRSYLHKDDTVLRKDAFRRVLCSCCT
ncbi:putative phytochrome-like histidine kinase PHY1p [Massarina eburnea CBS 473.64]|uniref:Putative phytochrome-like histidine kinase PHY1p n=1 Tax=Massarina eburnea CBS 473.64 TaxID=1395130 RepID=A0A6A6S3S0_9PLEO|nr:putative phytochrome-like histidine kinase PHY1p [Massarina eburnea CBS 473.64]